MLHSARAKSILYGASSTNAVGLSDTQVFSPIKTGWLYDLLLSNQRE